MMNIHSTNYDPITNVVRKPVGLRQTRTLKGVGYAYHKHMISMGANQGFEAALDRNPKEFHRNSGEFSKYKELLVRSRAKER